MSVAIVIPETWEPTQLVRWAATIARAKNEDLLIIRPTRRANHRKQKKTIRAAPTEGSPLAVALRDQAADFLIHDLGSKSVEERGKVVIQPNALRDRRVFLRELKGADLVKGVLNEIKALRVTTLIIPRHRGVRFNEDEFAAQRQLLAEAPCETVQLRPGNIARDNYGSVLVANSGSKHATPALHLGAKLGAGKAAGVTALFVDQQNVRKDRRDTPQIAERSVRTSFKKDAQIVRPDAVVDKDVPRGVSSYASAKGHDLIVVGGGSPSMADRPTRASISEKLLAGMDDHTVVVVRNRLPWVDRIRRALERRRHYFVPQLDREGRVALVTRLHSGAKWDFDFFFLISLATMLAALGLSINSSPVVIGAMLVAPLMTPMLGVGLSVVQGNRFMANDCLVSIRRGFVAAFLTGCAVGMIRFCFTSGVTEEMSSRGAPGILDLVVAFVSGVVAAYAFGRPHLLSVVPGIAIATSLVPPVATAGLSLCAMEWDVALGATLLFLSNFVSIVLGSALCLWFVGMRGPREFRPFATWARRLMIGTFFVAVGLAVYFSAGQGRSSRPPIVLAQQSGPEPQQPLPKAADEESQAPDSPLEVIAEEEGDRASDLLVRQQLEHVQVVLKPRLTDDQVSSITDVTLIVPGEPGDVELGGIIAKQTRPGWVTLDLPPRACWGGSMQQLTTRQQEGLESPDFFDLLEKHIAERLDPGLANPM